MPVTKSAQKQMRVAERRQVRNKPVQSKCKTYITKTEKSIYSGELQVAQEAAVAAVSALDKAVGKGVIHPNNAARRKSRLVKKLNRMVSSSSEESQTQTTTSHSRRRSKKTA